MDRTLPTRFRTWARAAGILAAVLAAAVAASATPMLVGYQGAVFDDQGAPVAGPVQLEVAIFDAASGGTELYREVHSGVALVDGAFDVQIGAGTPISGQFDAQTFESDGTWLELTVDGELMGPRQRMVAVPYALRAAVAETVLGGVTVTDDLQLTGSGSQLDGVPLAIENTNAVDGVAATFTNSSTWETARFTNTGGGEVLKLYGQGSGLDDAVLRVENTVAGSYSYAAAFTGKTRFDHTTSWSQPAVEIYGSGRWSAAPALRVENVRTDDTGIAGYFIAHSPQATLVSINDGPGESLSVAGMGSAVEEAALRVGNANPDRGMAAYLNNQSNYATAHLQNQGNGQVLWLQNDGGSGSSPGSGDSAYIVGVDEIGAPRFWIDGSGMAHVRALEILGGSDLSERFDVAHTPDVPVEPGTLVAIDPENPEGSLIPSQGAYARTVAGVVAGAGGIDPGMLMAQQGVAVADGEHPVALTGRVYAKADTSNGPIRPGDLLTTSERPGHAMKATDWGRSQGAVIGKALGSLDEETGLVLVLVGLQ